MRGRDRTAHQNSRPCCAHGSRLLLKTHEEITSFEIVRIIEKVGADVIGVLLDPVNFVARLEEPIVYNARVAPYVRQVHLEDFVVRYNDKGLTTACSVRSAKA